MLLISLDILNDILNNRTEGAVLLHFLFYVVYCINDSGVVPAVKFLSYGFIGKTGYLLDNVNCDLSRVGNICGARCQR